MSVLGFAPPGQNGCMRRAATRMNARCGGDKQRTWRTALMSGIAAGMVSTSLLFSGQAHAVLQEPPSHFAAVDSDDSEDVKFRVVWEGYRSENSQYGTVILFHNTSNLPIDINWISYSGREVNYAVMSPGETILQPTFASHPWSIRDHTSQTSLALTIAKEEASVVTISDKGKTTDLKQGQAGDPLLDLLARRG
mmetsp:Transcript_29126/g.113135  ORF Transcript_29126/g.113135 Transcript_29126/m.113135 type:complete len:194 (-) Transcript_29126:1548-2129(-)